MYIEIEINIVYKKLFLNNSFISLIYFISLINLFLFLLSLD